MTPELNYLVYAVILLIVHIAVQALLSDLSKGVLWAAGPQDTEASQNVFAGRIQRSLNNFLETFVAFAALAIVLNISGRGNETSALAAAVWFWARVIYVPTYVSGIPFARFGVWAVAFAALIVMAWVALMGGATE